MVTVVPFVGYIHGMVCVLGMVRRSKGGSIAFFGEIDEVGVHPGSIFVLPAMISMVITPFFAPFPILIKISVEFDIGPALRHIINVVQVCL